MRSAMCAAVILLLAHRALGASEEQGLLKRVVTKIDARAAVALARRGAAARPFLEQGVRHKNPRVAALCAWALWHHPEPSLAPALRPLLRTVNQVGGYWAAKALGRMQDRASAPALAALVPKGGAIYWELSRGNRVWLRNSRARRVKVPEYGDAAKMPNIRVAYAAVEALGRMGGTTATECLARALAHEQYLIRYGAARGIGTGTPDTAWPPSIVQQLARLASRDPVLIVREAAAEALAKARGAPESPPAPPPPMPPALVFIKARNRSESNLGFRDAYPFPKVPWYHWGESLCVLSPVGLNGQVRDLVWPKGGAVQGPEISYDGQRVLFAMRRDFKKEGFHIFEVRLDGTRLRQLTSGNCNDVDPCYLPDGRIVFCSDRSGFHEYYHQERSRVLYVMDADGSNIRQITFNPNSDYEPLVLHDGQVAYGSYRFYAQDGSPGPVRGEWLHQRIETVLRTVRPDGSNDQLLYGAMRGSFYCPLRPTPDSLQYSGWHPRGYHIGVAVSQARELSDKTLVCVSPAGLTHVDPRLPPTDCERPLYPEVLNLCGGEEVYIHNHDSMNPVGRYTSPCPVVPAGAVTRQAGASSSRWVFVSHAPWHRLGGAAYGIYLVDLATRRQQLVYDDPVVSDISPIPVWPRTLPPLPPSQRDPRGPPTGIVYCASVFHTDLPYDKSSVRYVRVIEALQQPLTINANASFRTRVLGTVPLDRDGSFHVEVPADTPFRFQLLDRDLRTVVHETAFTYVRPGETKGCIGCHEPKDAAAPNAPPLALRHPPARMVRQRGGLLYQGRPYHTYGGIVRE